MSTPNPLLVAEAPALISVLQAIKQFNTDMGPDPIKWQLNFPGSLLKLQGTVALALPAMAAAAGGALQVQVNNNIDAAIAKLQASVTPA